MKLLACFGLCLLALSCSVAKKTAVGEAKGTKMLSAVTVLKNLEQNKISVTWLESKINVNFESSVQSFGGTVRLRMRTDSLIWLNVTKFGIEVARVLITPDSCVLLNRLEGSYSVKNWEFIGQQIGLPKEQANFKNLQNIILGNIILLEGRELVVDTSNTEYRLSTKDKKPLQSEYSLSADNFLLKSMMIENVIKNTRFVTILEQNEPLGTLQNFSRLRKIKFRNPAVGTGEIECQFEKTDINIPKQMPFDIPSRYSRVD